MTNYDEVRCGHANGPACAPATCCTPRTCDNDDAWTLTYGTPGYPAALCYAAFRHPAKNTTLSWPTKSSLLCTADAASCTVSECCAPGPIDRGCTATLPDTTRMQWTGACLAQNKAVGMTDPETSPAYVAENSHCIAICGYNLYTTIGVGSLITGLETATPTGGCSTPGLTLTPGSVNSAGINIDLSTCNTTTTTTTTTTQIAGVETVMETVTIEQTQVSSELAMPMEIPAGQTEADLMNNAEFVNSILAAIAESLGLEGIDLNSIVLDGLGVRRIRRRLSESDSSGGKAIELKSDGKEEELTPTETADVIIKEKLDIHIFDMSVDNLDSELSNESTPSLRALATTATNLNIQYTVKLPENTPAETVTALETTLSSGNAAANAAFTSALQTAVNNQLAARLPADQQALFGATGAPTVTGTASTAKVQVQVERAVPKVTTPTTTTVTTTEDGLSGIAWFFIGFLIAIPVAFGVRIAVMKFHGTDKISPADAHYQVPFDVKTDNSKISPEQSKKTLEMAEQRILQLTAAGRELESKLKAETDHRHILQTTLNEIKKEQERKESESRIEREEKKRLLSQLEEEEAMILESGEKQLQLNKTKKEYQSKLAEIQEAQEKERREAEEERMNKERMEKCLKEIKSEKEELEGRYYEERADLLEKLEQEELLIAEAEANLRREIENNRRLEAELEEERRILREEEEKRAEAEDQIVLENLQKTRLQAEIKRRSFEMREKEDIWKKKLAEHDEDIAKELASKMEDSNAEREKLKHELSKKDQKALEEEKLRLEAERLAKKEQRDRERSESEIRKKEERKALEAEERAQRHKEKKERKLAEKEARHAEKEARHAEKEAKKEEKERLKHEKEEEKERLKREEKEARQKEREERHRKKEEKREEERKEKKALEDKMRAEGIAKEAIDRHKETEKAKKNEQRAKTAAEIERRHNERKSRAGNQGASPKGGAGKPTPHELLIGMLGGGSPKRNA